VFLSFSESLNNIVGAINFGEIHHFRFFQSRGVVYLFSPDTPGINPLCIIVIRHDGE
jgi:hypothetical protein